MVSRRRHAFIAWIALAAVLYAAATPLLAALRAQPQPEYLGALCTLGGAQQAPGQPAVPSEGGTSHQQHCVFCVGGAWQPPLPASLALPVPAASGLLAPTDRDDVLQSLAAALQPLSPRAPPRLV